MTLRILFALLILLPLLPGCGRHLTQAEKSFTQTIMGAQVDVQKVRLVKGTLIGKVTKTRATRPRLACRERIWPVRKTETVKTITSAFVLFNTVFLSHSHYSDDLMAGYPEKLPLSDAMLLAHEMTHVWQWQNREITGYYPLRAASEHKPGADPYLFNLQTSQAFLEYPYEQQASIVEEYVCCRTLDPSGSRTRRLRVLLQSVLPRHDAVSTTPNTVPVLPWQGAQTKGICS